MLLITQCIFYNLRFLSGTRADNLENRGGALSINCLESYESNISVEGNLFYDIFGKLLKGGVLSTTSCRAINFSANQIYTASGATGGSVYVENSRSANISFNIFSNLTSFGDGGSVYILSVTKAIFQANRFNKSVAVDEGGVLKVG